MWVCIFNEAKFQVLSKYTLEKSIFTLRTSFTQSYRNSDAEPMQFGRHNCTGIQRSTFLYNEINIYKKSGLTSASTPFERSIITSEPELCDLLLKFRI